MYLKGWKSLTRISEMQQELVMHMFSLKSRYLTYLILLFIQNITLILIG